MNKSILFSAFFLTSTLCADGDLAAAARPQQMNNNNMMSINTLTSARPESEYGWYLFADALYWHADVGNTDWASKKPANENNFIVKNVHHLDFKWSWGFKVGIGANIDHDMWDSNFYYTWFRTENSNAIGGDGFTVADNIGDFGTYSGLSSGKIDWTLHFNMFDWELGRWQYSSKNLALRPHAGIKGGWINQTIHARFSGTGYPIDPFAANANEKFENNFWGVGPSVGVNAVWVLATAGRAMDHRFSLLGDFSGALMYGHFQVKNNQRYYDVNGNYVSGLILKNLTRNLASTMLQGFFGLSWDAPFNQNRNHFMMKVGYELQYWFRQNQLVMGLHMRRYSDDLALQGVTGEFRFDF